MEESQVKEAVNAYIEKLQAYSDNDCKTNYQNNWENGLGYKYTVDRTPKWFKLWQSVKDQKSIFAFIDPATGDIYKPAGLNSAAKGIRGNVFNEKLPLTQGALYR